MFANIYRNRRVLVTGHTGFKGSWLTAWLLDLGAQVTGFSLGVPTEPANFGVLGLSSRIQHVLGDVRDRATLQQTFAEAQPEIVFHLAAQALVRQSYSEPTTTFETNALGTLNVLECIRQESSVQAGVLITSDKCYRNAEWTWGYRENDVLGGEDPYSASKACAEVIAYSYIKSYFQSGPAVATTRAGNVIGGGDWAADRIVPDCVRAWSESRAVVIRNPAATRPWQHVLEPLSGYLWLGARLLQGDQRATGEAFNFGPVATVNQPVSELIDWLAHDWPSARIEHKPETAQGKPEAMLLKLNCDKALNYLGWHAVLSFEDAVCMTREWYRAYYDGKVATIGELTSRQIAEYAAKAGTAGMPWVR